MNLDAFLLTRRDRKLIEDLAVAAGCSPEAMLRQSVIEYLNMVRNAPRAVPKSPLRDKAMSLAGVRL